MLRDLHTPATVIFTTTGKGSAENVAGLVNTYDPEPLLAAPTCLRFLLENKKRVAAAFRSKQKKSQPVTPLRLTVPHHNFQARMKELGITT